MAEDYPRGWLLVKRGLFERPDRAGYTGLRDQAGRFTLEEARSITRDPEDGITMLHETEAPMFSAVADMHVVARYLAGQVTRLTNERDRFRRRLEQRGELFTTINGEAHPIGHVISLRIDGKEMM